MHPQARVVHEDFHRMPDGQADLVDQPRDPLFQGQHQLGRLRIGDCFVGAASKDFVGGGEPPLNGRAVGDLRPFGQELAEERIRVATHLVRSHFLHDLHQRIDLKVQLLHDRAGLGLHGRLRRANLCLGCSPARLGNQPNALLGIGPPRRALPPLDHIAADSLHGHIDQGGGPRRARRPPE
jgi:hypothetical protein